MSQNTSIQYKALTYQFDRIVRDIVTEVHITKAVDPGFSFKPTHTCQALWDTGASISFITKDMVNMLGLKEHDEIKVQDFDGIWTTQKTYLIALGLDNGAGISSFRVAAQEKKHPYDLVIGMDLIQIGDFSIENSSGKTLLTFKYPVKTV